MRTLLAQQPLQSRWIYLRRVLKYAGMKVLSVAAAVWTDHSRLAGVGTAIRTS